MERVQLSNIELPQKDLADMVKRYMFMLKTPHAQYSLCKVAGEKNFGHSAVRYKTHVIVLADDGTKILDLVTGKWTQLKTEFSKPFGNEGALYHTCNLIRHNWLILIGGGRNESGQIKMLYLLKTSPERPEGYVWDEDPPEFPEIKDIKY